MIKIENKEMLLYSVNKSINNVAEVQNHADTSDSETYYTIGTAIHWTVDCIDRIPAEILQDDTHKDLFRAIRCVNNCLKHNRTFKSNHNVRGFSFPFSSEVKFGNYFVWAELDEIEVSKKYKDNFEKSKECYDRLLRGNEVFKTLRDIEDIIKIYYSKL